MSAQVLNDQVNHVLSSVRSLLDHAHTLDLNNLQAVKGAVGDVRALQLVTGTEGRKKTGTEGRNKTGTEGRKKTGNKGRKKTGTKGRKKKGEKEKYSKNQKTVE